jgi:hypothetical protein
VRAVKHYFEYLTQEARRRYDAGMSEDDAVRDISLAGFSDWIDAERVIVNVATLYREFGGGGRKPDVMDFHARMARMRKERRSGAR